MLSYTGTKPVLCWDAGHGGYDPGAVGYDLQEKDITLAIVLAGKPIAEANGITVILTRDGDYAPGHLENQLNAELQMRCTIANQAKADLFCSTHINSGGGEGQEILIQASGGNAEKAANIMLSLLTATGGWYCRGVKIQNDEVTRNTNMPAILTESGFIDSRIDTDKLKYPTFIQALAETHVRGFCEIFGLPFNISSVGGGEIDVLQDLVVYADGDVGAALLLSYKLRCPMVLKGFDVGITATNRHHVGLSGTNGNGDFYYSGADRIATALQAL